MFYSKYTRVPERVASEIRGVNRLEQTEYRTNSKVEAEVAVEVEVK